MLITRRLEFDAGHRVLGHEGKCATLHGHRYAAEISISPADGLDSLGRVIDYGCVKRIVGGWIDENWDHAMLLHPEDPLLDCPGDVIGPRAPYAMPDGNPTAENIAKRLFLVAEDLLRPEGVLVKRVRIYETPNCWADYAC